jgi:hypothetical protein
MAPCTGSAASFHMLVTRSPIHRSQIERASKAFHYCNVCIESLRDHVFQVVPET